MTTAVTRSVLVTEPSQVGEARRVAISLADAAGFTEVQRGDLSIVVTEAATNIIKHAREGEMLFRLVSENSVPGLELLALDKGAGMGEIRRCFEDGYSTAGSSGNGLGAVARLSTCCNIFSPSNQGTALMTRFVTPPKAQVSCSRPGFELGAVAVPFDGELNCGDAWAMIQYPDWTKIIVVDGLGHGDLAGEASKEALRIFGENAPRSPGELIHLVHGALFKTRGAAAAVAQIEPEKQCVTFAGVGNISCRVVDPQNSKNLVSHNGIAGHFLSRVHEYQAPWNADALLVMHTDGISTRWELGNYPGLIRQHPSIIAGVLYRDFQRGRDDATVVVLREPVAE
jgi:anti-sigma regulatory factor (Ser/Thr protein kinase)